MKNFFMQWHITDRCDQRCKHCYIYNGKDKFNINELDFNTCKQIILSFISMCDKLERKPLIVITGGDPLLHPNFWDILEFIQQNNIEFHILGNPFHLTNRVAENLKKLGCTAYQMSLDGLEKTHDSIRKPGSFNETIKKIKILNEAKISSGIMTTVSKTNISEIPELVDIVVKNEASSFGFSRYCPNPGDENLIVTADEYHTFLEKMWKKFEEHKESKTYFSLKDHLWTLFLYEKGLYKIPENLPDYIYDGCHCGITHITVISNGDVYACRRSYTPIGHLPQESLYDIFMGEKMNQYRDFDRFEKCKNCELLRFCRGCPSVAKCLTGNFYGADPQCWKK